MSKLINKYLLENYHFFLLLISSRILLKGYYCKRKKMTPIFCEILGVRGLFASIMKTI